MLNHSFDYPSNKNIFKTHFKGLNNYSNFSSDKISDIPADLLFSDTFWPDKKYTVGCKMFWGLRYHGTLESDMEATYYWLRNFLYIIKNYRHGLKIIFLDRKNILQQYLSLKLATDSNRWSTLTPPNKEEDIIKFISKDFVNYLASQISSLYKPTFIKTLINGLPNIHIDYADLSSPEKAVKTLDKIFCFLEVDNININCRSVKYKKLHSLHPVEMVTNPDVLVSFLQKNGLARYLSDDYLA